MLFLLFPFSSNNKDYFFFYYLSKINFLLIDMFIVYIIQWTDTPPTPLPPLRKK